MAVVNETHATQPSSLPDFRIPEGLLDGRRNSPVRASAARGPAG